MKEVDKGVDKMITKKTENSTLKDAETVCENGKKKGKSERLPTKVVVRRLPPTMTKETFVQQCSPVPPVDYMYFVQADMSLAPQCFSRAYLNFVNHQDIFTFTQKFDNYVFVDVKGQEYPAVVEFAPFQRIPKRRPNRKKDPKIGTIESSPIFISFKEKLETEIQENKTSANSIKQHFFETSTNSEDKKETISTPLLDFIKTRKAERQRIRDEKREEKRKRDLERRRAKDEMRKLKKDEESSPVVKVLHGSTFGKDKPKDKEINKSTIKKRSDEFIKPLKDKSSVESRSRENRGRIGKSYQEERQRQAERREEQRKKSASYYQNTTSSESKVNQNETTKQEKPEKEKEKAETNTEEKPSPPVDNKIRETDKRKNERIYKRDEIRRSSQKLDVRRDTDDGRKRGRGPERFSYGHRRDDDKRDDYYGGGRRKPNNDTKKSQEYTSYADKNRDRLRGRFNQKKTSEPTVDSEKVKNSQEEKTEIIKNNSKDDAEKTDKTEISKKELNETKEQLEPENTVRDAEPSENQLFKLSTKLKMLNESVTVNNKSKLTRRNSLESGPNQMKSSSEEQSKELGLECKRRNSVGSHNYRPKEEHKDAEKVDNPSSLIEKNSEESGNSENVNSTLAVEKNETCDNDKIEIDGEKKADEETIKSQEKEVPKRRKSMEEKSGELVTAGLESGLLLARRNSLESGELSKKCNDTSKSKSSLKLDKDDTENRSNKDPRSERRIRNKDRPTMELYRPGMGRFSKQRLEREKVLGSSTEVESPSSSPSPTPVSKPKYPATAKEN